MSTVSKDKPRFGVLCGDALAQLGKIKESNVELDCVVTSPPYFQKRTYGSNDQEVGQEDDVPLYLEKLCDIFDAIPLAQHGSLWVNLGDTRHQGGLLMVPSRFALQMQERGWTLVDEVVWAKGCVDVDGTASGQWLPEPAEHRLNGNAVEFIFRFIKGKTAAAWTDVQAVSIPRAGVPPLRYLPETLMRTATCIQGRCLPTAWRCPMGQAGVKHFAVYPTSLVERPIAMTCPVQVCSTCGQPRRRLVEKVVYEEPQGRRPRRSHKASSTDGISPGRNDTQRLYEARMPVTRGWTDCGHDDYHPGRVLDPFAGSGTTGEVSIKLGRDFIGIDLYPENVRLAVARCQAAERAVRDSGIDIVRHIVEAVPRVPVATAMDRALHEVAERLRLSWNLRCFVANYRGDKGDVGQATEEFFYAQDFKTVEEEDLTRDRLCELSFGLQSFEDGAERQMEANILRFWESERKAALVA